MYNVIILILPEIIIAVMACFILILDLFIKKEKKAINYHITQATLIITSFVLILIFGESKKCLIFGGAFRYDVYGIILKITILSTAYMIFVYSKIYDIYELIQR
ncbi:MAG TPA: hypothetical protein ACYCDB_01920 [Candidatus Azoamicus sp.]